MKDEYTDWAHGPTHLFVPNALYFVTGGTYYKERFFNTPGRLTLLWNELLRQAERFSWQFHAWAILQNHYHFVAQAPDEPKTLRSMIQAVHSISARAVNAEDKVQGRKIWYQFRDTCITHEKSYFARLHYTHTNPVKHGVVQNAENYEWCSMATFLRESTPGFRKTVLSFPIDAINVWDDF